MSKRLASFLALALAAGGSSVWGTPRILPTGVKPTQKVVVNHGVQGPGRLLASYDSFDVYEAATDELAGVSARNDLDELHLNVGSFDTQLAPELPGVPARLRDQTDPKAARLVLIQFVGPIQDRWLDEIRATGASIVHAIPTDGMLVWAPAGAAARLNSLAAEHRILQYAGPFHPHYKVSKSLLAPQSRAKDELITVVVQRYAKSRLADSDPAIAALAEEVVVPWEPILDYENARLRVRPDRIEEIARRPEVVWVGEWKAPELMDEVQDQILAGHLDSSFQTPTGPGYLAWLQSLGFSSDPADYAIVNITDDGIGNGTVGTGDATLHVAGDLQQPTRVTINADCTGQGAHGPDGHGHINTNIALGYDARGGAPFKDAAGYSRGLGVNPFGRIAGLRIFDDSGRYVTGLCGNTDANLIKKSYQNGARISSNSWGADVLGEYEASAQAYDAGTRDALPQTAGNQQMLFIFAAGNAGPAAGTVGSPGSAKNVVTVGATENVRPDGTDRCGVGPNGADNATQLIDFSSRGSAQGGRFKPEVVAPGTHVQGTASTTNPFLGAGVCDKFWPPGQTVFARSSGTSHSTPAISGVLSLYERWLRTEHGLTPSPAMLKAYLLAHTRKVRDTGAPENLPSNNQGYGMPVLADAFDDAPRILVDQTTRFDSSGQSFTVDAATMDPGKPFRAALVWTDAPGSLSGAPQVNDLDLEVIVNGVTYHGNHFSGATSVPGGIADTANNAELVVLPAAPASPIQVRVIARNIAGDGVPGVGDATDQDFALVVYNASQDPNFLLGSANPSARVCHSGQVSVPIQVFSVGGFNAPVTMRVEGLPAGTTASFAPPAVTPPGTTMMTLSVPADIELGSKSIRVVGKAGQAEKDRVISLSVDEALPSPVTKEPRHLAASVDPQATLSWFPITGAADYRVQVAKQSGFNPLVANQITADTAATVSLDQTTHYFWRIQGRNACGDGPFSTADQSTGHPGDVLSFTTATVTDVAPACSGLPKPIPDANPTGISCTMDVPADFKVLDVTLDIRITHTYRGDLQVDLVSPAGTHVRLKGTDPGDAAVDVVGNFDNTLSLSGPGTMDDFTNENGGGTWRVEVVDNLQEDTGRLQSAKLHVHGFAQPPPVVPVVGWLGGALAVALAGWLCQRSARRRLGTA